MRLINSNLFKILYNFPVLGGVIVFITIIPIINNKTAFSEEARQGILMQFFAPLVYVIGRTISYLLWFLFGFMTFETIISWISLFWLLGCYVYMLFGTFKIILGANFSYRLFKKPLRLIEYFIWH